MLTTQAEKRRFWARVEKTPKCWLWRGYTAPNGYGNLKVKRKNAYAHRVAYELRNGPVPLGKWVLHRCDVRHCVRGSHLFAGSAADNAADMVAKGRHKPASLPKEQNPNARVSAPAVQALREEYARGGVTQVQLARKFKVSQTQVSRIVRGEQWACGT